eukprot:6274256-Prymnesium_polylepis.1
MPAVKSSSSSWLAPGKLSSDGALTTDASTGGAPPFTLWSTILARLVQIATAVRGARVFGGTVVT